MKLPDHTALGSPSLPQPSGQAPSYSPGGFTPAIPAGGGAGFEQAGNALIQFGAQQKNKADTLQNAQADADFSISSDRLFTAYAKSRDFENASGQFRADSTAELDRVAQGISDPYRRELFVQKHRASVESRGQRIDEHLWKQYAGDVLAKNDERFTELARQGLANPDPAYRDSVVRNVKTIIDGEIEAGYMTRGQGKARMRQFAEKYAEAFVKTLPPEEAIKLLSPFVQGAPKAEARNPRSAAAMGVDAPGGADQPATGSFTTGLADAVKKFEGYRTTAYWDHKQHSIGYGTRATGAGETIDKATAEARLNEELDKAAKIVDRVNPNLAAGPRAALISLTYNAGGGWANAELGQRVAAGDMQGAKERFVQYNKASGNVDAGLVSRRAQEVTWFDRGPPGSQDAAGGGPSGMKTNTLADFLPPDKIPALYEGATKLLLAQRTADSTNRGDELERMIIDGKAGVSLLPPRDIIESDTRLNEDKRNKLLKEYDGAVKDVGVLASVVDRFKGAPGSFNPYDKDERKAVDKFYQMIGGKDADPAKQTTALQAVVERTATIPDSVALSIRGGMTSTDPAIVQRSLDLAASIQSRSRAVFAGASGQKELEEAATTYRHFIDERGMTAVEATRRIMEAQTPEHQEKLNKIKGDDLKKIVTDKLSIRDIEGKYDLIPWIPFTDPKVGFSEGQKQAMFDTYVAEFKDRYLAGPSGGDVEASKKGALEQLKKVWGVTSVGGKDIVTQYPPEKSPRFDRIENAAELIAKQAISAIKTEAGIDVTRDKLQFLPVSNGVTARAYKEGLPTPYQLWWQDKNGSMQTSQRAFVPDANQAIAEAGAKRQADFAAGRTSTVARAQRGDEQGKPLRELFQANQQRRLEMESNRGAAIKGGPRIAGPTLSPGGETDLNIGGGQF